MATLGAPSWLGGVGLELPVLALSGAFHHQGPVGKPLLSCADPAIVDARYQRRGESGVWYGSSMQRGAWAEMFRHWEPGGVSPYEIRRRVGRVTASGLQVLDLRRADVQAELGLTRADLTGSDYAKCQEVAALARGAGLDGVLGPSAALEDCDTLAVYQRALGSGRITADHSRVQRPPVTMRDQVKRIRSVASDAVRATRELQLISISVTRH